MNSNPIKYQAQELWHNIRDPYTGAVYKQAVNRTWQLLKQAVKLVFLLFLLVAVVVTWLWSYAFESGVAFRQWLYVEKPTLGEILKAAGVALKEKVDWLAQLSRAKTEALLEQTPALQEELIKVITPVVDSKVQKQEQEKIAQLESLLHRYEEKYGSLSDE